MGEEYRKIVPKRYARFEAKGRKEENLWKKFKFPVTVKEFSPITCIDFSPTKPHDFIVTCSSKIDIYSQATNKPRKSITKFKANVASGRFRKDGKLIVAGGDDKIVKVFDAETKTSLRQFTGHSNAVHYTTFDIHGTGIFSGSDDRLLKLWDLPTEKEVFSFRGHEDYIRTGTTCQLNGNLIASGSYDHTVKLWDTRTNTCTLSLMHGDPVESVVLFPGGGLCISSGSNSIKVWDILYGGQLVTSFSNHAKTVTSLCLNASSSRLLAGSLDRDVKIYDVMDYSVVATVDYPSGVLSVGFSPDQSHLVVGMVDGLVSIKEQTARPSEPESIPTTTALSRSKKRISRKEEARLHHDAFIVRRQKGPRKNQVEKLLSRFEHGKALDRAIARKGTQPGYVIGVFREIARRNNLRRALSDRTATGLTDLLTFIKRYITDPRFSGVLTEITNLLLDIYETNIGDSPAVDRLFLDIKHKVQRELKIQRTSFQLVGAIDTLLAASALVQQQS